MFRRVVTLLCLCAFAVCLGCGGGGGDDKANNPNSLPYSKEGPPKRDGAKGEVKKR